MEKLDSKKLELLSPAKNLQTAISAINSGADAIYIGASDFGARQNAANSLSDIKKLIDFAHLFNVKIYVTVNTLLNDDELLSAKELIWKLYDIKADGIIVQDFGILYLSATEQLPPIALHASTQCDNRNIEKVKFFEKIGLKRVVLARELPLVEIEKISKNCHIELEHFVHGALCVCYSGQCYLSEYIGDGSRCANRGSCAQPCRKKYSLVDEKGKYILKNKYLLSLKDNNLSNHLDKLISSGVKSFKIEGRLKDENYVKNITLYYHNLLKNYPRISHGKIVSDFIPNPNKSFNRGFCDDYLFNKKDNIYNFLSPKSMGEYVGVVENSSPDGFVVKTKIELNPQDGLCFEFQNELQGCLINSVSKVKSGVKIIPNKKIVIPKGVKIFRNIDVKFLNTLENSKTVRKLDVIFKVFEDKIEVFDDFSNKIVVTFESKEFANNQEKMKENFKKSLSKTNDTPYFVKNIEFLAEKLPFLPVSQINELRRQALDDLSKKILEKYKTKKQKPVEIAKFPLNEGDFKLNIKNKYAKEFYEMCGCKEAKNNNKKELMRMKHCLKRATLGCKANDKLFLEDEKGVKYPLLFDCKNCEMAILEP